MSQKRIGFVVSGKVQNVFFRDFTQTKATEYGIVGWVRNESNGTVRGEAQGLPDSIDKLKKDLNVGPTHARVVRLEIQDLDVVNGKEQSFVA